MAWLGPFPPVNHQPEQLHGAVSRRPRTTGRGVDMIMQNYVGCDISKMGLDFFDETSGHCQRIDNQADAIAAYVAGLQPDRDFVVGRVCAVLSTWQRWAPSEPVSASEISTAPSQPAQALRSWPSSPSQGSSSSFSTPSFEIKKLSHEHSCHAGTSKRCHGAEILLRCAFG